MSVVGLNQDADCETGASDLGDSRGRADAALETVAHHSCAASDIALGHWPTGRRVQSLKDMFLRDVEGVDIV